MPTLVLCKLITRKVQVLATLKTFLISAQLWQQTDSRNTKIDSTIQTNLYIQLVARWGVREDWGFGGRQRSRGRK